MKRIALLVTLLLVGVYTAEAQTTTVPGTVLDPNPTYSCARYGFASNFWGAAKATTGTITRGRSRR
jgi:hypothetical protein